MERKRSPESDPEAGPEDGDPAGKKRLLLCADFISVASCDEAVARRYLAENAWEVERALNAYFEPRAEEDALPRRPATSPAPPGSCVDLTQEEAPAPRGPSGPASPPLQEDGSAFSLVTWNVDGLDLNNLRERAQAVCACIALYSPDLVFLQEVIPPYHSMLKKKASSYEIITGHDAGYFTAIMLKKSRVKLKSHEIIPFPNTQMMRNLLCVHASVSGNELFLMNSHLESTREHAEERASQFKMVLRKMQEAPESATVIFAGDTNLRDQEVTKWGGLPGSISDVWELLGKPQHCRYTWDTRLNSNLGIRATCRHRFDRILLRAPAAGGGRLVPRSLDLLGLEKLDCGRFPSDHWGLLCTWDVIL
ncbi:tyrosyl-DNA phosphodiesterase 2 [Pipistrellus kuhlii]|uniref:Tyrosyl-DNA phosphodiesterase 2 n=1 Tax=Pipistrellus kuhlii TaxID=59472 RepID=A0A7J7TWR6_PIPKU|nr:tyrosyl-DNA phosphodiesterase 2 [Pipistrellus kuhlii]KAF6305031.1 tyrosyl-DNA phosphodiesterase 2 [Pipistrellus kuhlii]